MRMSMYRAVRVSDCVCVCLCACELVDEMKSLFRTAACYYYVLNGVVFEYIKRESGIFTVTLHGGTKALAQGVQFGRAFSPFCIAMLTKSLSINYHHLNIIIYKCLSFENDHLI